MNVPILMQAGRVMVRVESSSHSIAVRQAEPDSVIALFNQLFRQLQTTVEIIQEIEG